MTQSNKTAKSAKGKIAENLAADHLRRLGYTIMAQNWRHGRAEIDIIAQKDNLCLFVEVKARSRVDYGYPESFVTAAQADRIMQASEAWLEQRPWPGEIRFDIMAITLKNEQPIVEIFEDAFY